MRFACTTRVTIHADSAHDAQEFQDGIITELQNQGYVVDSVLTPLDSDDPIRYWNGAFAK